MPTNREVDAVRVERQRRQAEQRATQETKPRTALERRLARIDAAHKAATAPAWWACRVPGCDPSRRPASSSAAAQAAAMAHHDANHPHPVPADLEEQRAAWVAAGCPPLGVPPWNTGHAC